MFYETFQKMTLDNLKIPAFFFRFFCKKISYFSVKKISDFFSRFFLIFSVSFFIFFPWSGSCGAPTYAWEYVCWVRAWKNDAKGTVFEPVIISLYTMHIHFIHRFFPLIKNVYDCWKSKFYAAVLDRRVGYGTIYVGVVRADFSCPSVAASTAAASHSSCFPCAGSWCSTLPPEVKKNQIFFENGHLFFVGDL